ncbi:MAG: hypothetical protein JSS81_30310 [Acidobacteria bacterium]|nr:hypothetical protein [Acidobacteriota bacterium]
MEIWIIGIFIVALMVYLSTRIKRSAAAAFAEERVETDDFSLVKPEGFLSPVENDEYLAFYAYSKEFGDEGDTEKQRQSLIRLKTQAGRELAEVRREVKKSFDKLLSEEKTGDAEFLLTGEKSERDVERVVYHKLVARGERIFDLEMTVLADKRENYEETAEKLFDGFRVK